MHVCAQTARRNLRDTRSSLLTPPPPQTHRRPKRNFRNGGGCKSTAKEGNFLTVPGVIVEDGKVYKTWTPVVFCNPRDEWSADACNC